MPPSKNRRCSQSCRVETSWGRVDGVKCVHPPPGGFNPTRLRAPPILLAEKSDKQMPPQIHLQLERYSIPVDEFETLLREEVALQHPEYLEECVQRGLGPVLTGGQLSVAREQTPVVDAEEGALAMLIRELRSTQHDLSVEEAAPWIPNSSASLPVLTPPGASPPTSANEITSERSRVGEDSKVWSSITLTQSQRGEYLDGGPERIRDAEIVGYTVVGSRTSRDKKQLGVPVTTPKSGADPTFMSAPSSADSVRSDGEVEVVGDYEALPYHVAVRCSLGVLAKFVELLNERVKPSDDPRATITMNRVGAEVTTTRESICAAQYAYYMCYREVGDALAARMGNPPVMTTSAAASVALREDAHDFPFVLVDQESEGDVEECEDYIDAMDEENGALEATIEADVTCQRVETVHWTPVDYACHLGYVEIAKYLFKEIYTEVPIKNRIQAIKHARDRAKAAAAPA